MTGDNDMTDLERRLDELRRRPFEHVVDPEMQAEADALDNPEAVLRVVREVGEGAEEGRRG